MTEPKLLDRIGMILKTVASIVVWVAAILAKIVRGVLPGGSSKPSTPVPMEDTPQQ